MAHSPTPGCTCSAREVEEGAVLEGGGVLVVLAVQTAEERGLVGEGGQAQRT